MHRTLLGALLGALVTLLVVVPTTIVVAGGGNDPYVEPPVARVAQRAATTTHDLVYVPVDSCRVVDTRSGGGALQPGVPRSVAMLGLTRNYSGQGGSATGCAVPFNAEAVNLTTTSIGATGRGSVRLWPSDKPIPLGPALTYNDLILASSTIAVPVCQGPCGGGDLRVQATGQPTHVSIDVVGYWVPPLWARVSSGGTLVDGSGVGTVARNSTGEYVVVFNRNVSACSATVTTTTFAGTAVQPSVSSPNAFVVFTITEDGSSSTNAGFYLQVLC